MKIEAFVTSWGSQISPYIQKQVIKRINSHDDVETIVQQEIKDILDYHHHQFDEAFEIVSHCEKIIETNLKPIVD